MRSAKTLILLLAAAVLAGCAAMQITASYSRERDLITGRAKSDKIGVSITIPPQKDPAP